MFSISRRATRMTATTAALAVMSIGILTTISCNLGVEQQVSEPPPVAVETVEVSVEQLQDVDAPNAQEALEATGPISYTENDLIANGRQLILEGLRSGEGYYSSDDTRMIFQAEREPENPFYQQYILDMTTGEIEMLSTGVGKTTCGWFHPTDDLVLFASTHEDPDAPALMQEMLELRASGDAPRYSFEYDDTYEIYTMTPGTNDYTNVTNSPGYDAEGSWSPDGTKIAFTSNRLAYTDPDSMTAEDLEWFELDVAYMNDIYLMDTDGSNVVQLTDKRGYDGGPFFSPDGNRITWRSFNEEGSIAEIWTMNIDGSDKKRLTSLDVMSWAPYYHPSGEYVVFATNVHGFQNFEIYMVDVNGTKEPMQVTFWDGSDVLPVFTNSGDRMSWVSRRGADGLPHIHIGDWNHEKALELLSIAPNQGEAAYDVDTAGQAVADMSATEAEVRPEDARLHVEQLASEAMEGRLTGTPGEALATAYVADVFEQIGLEPQGTDGYFQPFEFTSGVSLSGMNVLSVEDGAGESAEPEVDVEWRPLSFSKTGSVGHSDLVFAGYGVVAPDAADQEGYDSYGDLDVDGKWAVVLRYLPEDIDPEWRQHLQRYASLRFKAMEARDRGAKGLVVVSGPDSKVTDQLVPLAFDGTVAGSSIPAISVTDALAEPWFEAAGTDLASAQAALDGGEEEAGFELPGAKLGAHVELAFDEDTGRNVLGRLVLGDSPSEEVIIVGAHVDHLGHGASGDSLAGADEAGQIHYGADDNASGVAGMIEIAQALASDATAGKLGEAERDFVFAAWSGEELGLLGSNHYVQELDADADGSLYPGVSAYLNLDMVGRGTNEVIMQGIASSPYWKGEIEKRNVVVGLPLQLSDDTYLPTDATSFYLKGVPILAAFTNVHEEYNTPRDTAEKIDYDALAKIARLFVLVAQDVAVEEEAPEYVKVEETQAGSHRRVGRVYLGTIPDYASMAGVDDESAAGGVKMSGVSAKGPAEEAGVQPGDIVVELAGQPIGDVYEYTKVLDALTIGEETTIVVVRDGERIELKITPSSRE